MLETSGPVPAFTDAVQTRDVDRIAGLLAHDVRLSVPPLHYTRRGTQDVVAALVGLLRSFGELRYDVRSRYVAPGTVTDEAMLVGRQTGPFLGGPPGGRTSTVAARLIITHDAATVTSITAWPDLSALGTAVSGIDRLIDVTRIGGAGAMVATLRATIPPSQARLIIGSAREERPVATAAAEPAGSVTAAGATTAGGDAAPRGHRATPKPPVPRPVRRRRAFAAGTAMLAMSSGLTIWVGTSALNQPEAASPRTQSVTLEAQRGQGRAGSGAAGSDAGASGPGASASGASASGASNAAADPVGAGAGLAPGGQTTNADAAPAGAPQHLTRNQVTVILQTDLLFFDTDQYRLRPDAGTVLATLIADAREQRRHGQVIVRGYTDDVGEAPYNLRLARLRAETVAKVLRVGLAHTGMTVRSRGYGEANPEWDNSTAQGRQGNRRVVVTFPRASGSP